MNNNKNINIFIFFLGDFILFFIALLLTLAVKNFNSLFATFYEHSIPFLFLFFLYEFILLVIGLWDKKFVFSAKNTFDLLLPYHILSTLLMAVFFYMLPVFHIAPKTNMIIFSIILFVFIYL